MTRLSKSSVLVGLEIAGPDVDALIAAIALLAPRAITKAKPPAKIFADIPEQKDLVLTLILH